MWSLTARGETIGQCPAEVTSGGEVSSADVKPPTNSSPPSPGGQSGKLWQPAAGPRAAAARRMRSLRVRREVLHEAAAAPARSAPDPSPAGEDLMEVEGGAGDWEASGEPPPLPEDVVVEHDTILGDRLIDFSNLTPMVKKAPAVSRAPEERPQSDAPAPAAQSETDQMAREMAEAARKKAAQTMQQQKNADPENSSQKPTMLGLEEQDINKETSAPEYKDPLTVSDTQDKPVLSKSDVNVLSQVDTKIAEPVTSDDDLTMHSEQIFDKPSETIILPILNEKPPLLSDSQTKAGPLLSPEELSGSQEHPILLPSHILLNSLPGSNSRQNPTSNPPEKPTTAKAKEKPTTPSASQTRPDRPRLPVADPSLRPQHDAPWPATPRRRDSALVYDSEVVEFVPLADRPPAGATSSPPPPWSAAPRWPDAAPTQSDSDVSGQGSDAGSPSDFGGNEILRTGSGDDEEKLAAGGDRVAMTTSPSPSEEPEAPPPVPVTADSAALPVTPRTVTVTIAVDGGELYQLSLTLPADDRKVTATLQKTEPPPASAPIREMAETTTPTSPQNKTTGATDTDRTTESTAEPSTSTTESTEATTASTTASTTTATTPAPAAEPTTTAYPTTASPTAAVTDATTEEATTVSQPDPTTAPPTTTPTPVVESSESRQPDAPVAATTSLPSTPPPPPPTDAVTPPSVTPSPSCVRPSTVTVTFPPPVPIIVVEGELFSFVSCLLSLSFSCPACFLCTYVFLVSL